MIKAVPARFLHCVGSFHSYDPVSKILLSGDTGASMLRSDVDRPIETWAGFRKHIALMRPFHQSCMASNGVSRLWAGAVSQLFRGPQAIGDVIRWISHLACGVDLAPSEHYETR